MKRIVFLLIFLCFNAEALAQEVRYIRDTLYVPVRSGQSPQSEILRPSLVSGTPITLLNQSEDENYSFIRTDDGVEGWIQSQYLMETPAAKNLLQGVSEEAEQLRSRNTELQQQISTIETSNSDIETRLTQVSEQALAHQTELENLKEISTDAIQLDANNQNLLLENLQLSNRLQVLESETQRLQEILDNNNFWNGAFAVLLGVLITLVIPRVWPSKRSEWS